jgi:Kef-type K+ transport system membrane component KefB
VLARILAERRLLGTPVGAVTLACAAVDDVTAWTILAGVVLLVRNTGVEVPLWLTVAGSLAFVALMVGAVRPLLARRFGSSADRDLSHDRLGVILAVAIGSAIVTEALGIHALFGAFLAGAVMPRTAGFVEALDERLQDFTVVLLLPLFFAYTGLRTRIDLLGDAESWLIFGAVMAVAVAGKLGGSAIAARASGMSWRDSTLLGTLMNTRGLMELVVLNLGLEIGIISPRLFAIMVLMALATTFMTTPIVALLKPATDAGRAPGGGR